MKAMKKVLAFVLALAMVVTAVPVTNAAAKTANLSAGKTVNKSYYTGKTHTLKLTGVTKADVKSTTWKSSNAKVVKIVADSQTKVSAQFKCVKKGTATVTATVTLKNGNTKTYKAKITVKAPTLTVSPSAVNLTVGQTQAITVKKTPSGAKLTYTSSDPGVASISGKKITAHSAGKATITVQLTNGTKKITKKVDVTVSAAVDGLTATLTNPFTADYPNTVLVGQNAMISVACIQNGKPVAGKSIVMSIDTTKAQGAYGHYEVVNPQRDTDANGIATFVIRNYAHTNLKITDRGEIANLPYVVQVQGDNQTITAGSVAFAAYYVVPVTVKSTTNDTLKAGQNFTGASAVVNTADMADPTTANDQYVMSQQVSADDVNHAVTFQGGYPKLIWPGEAGDVTNADKMIDSVNFDSGAYHVYKANETTTWNYTLKENPDKLTYATIHFTDLKLSAHTRLVIERYDASNNKIGDPYIINGESNQAKFDYQIPLGSGVRSVKVYIESQGQVDLGMNGGYKVSGVTYVYKKNVAGNGNTDIPVKNALTTWSIAETPFTDEKVIHTYTDDGQTDSKYGIAGVKGGKLTEKLPAFPYTGTAVLTNYDANGNVTNYYAVETINRGLVGDHSVQNENVVLATNRKYDINADELRDQRGTLTPNADGSEVTVDSKESGRSTLVGTITINGQKIDAEYGEVYTSVLWNPIPNAADADNSQGFVALLGQNIEVIAQLTDRNGNSVTRAGEQIIFSYLNANTLTTIPAGTSRLNGRVRWDGSKSDVKVVDLVTTTDKNGQGKITLTAGDVRLIEDLQAACANRDYNVKLMIKNQATGAYAEPTVADLYWLDADLKFTTSAIDSEKKDVATTDTAPRNETGANDITPKAGSNWEYGVKVDASWLPYGYGVLGGTNPNGGGWTAVNGLDVQMSKAAGSVGTVTVDANDKTRVTATSQQAGPTQIVSKIDSKSVTAQTQIVSQYQGVYAGTGQTSISKRLTLNVQWMQNGIKAEFITPNGASIYDRADAPDSIDVYVKVTDTLGNPLKDAEVTFTKDTLDGQVQFEAAPPKTTVTNGVATTTTDDNGVAKVVMTQVANTTDVKTTVSAKVKGLDGVAQVYTWVQPEDADLLYLNTGRDDNGNFVTNYDNKTGVITLNFKADIVETSLQKEMITAIYTGPTSTTKFIIKNVVVNKNVVSITVDNPIVGFDARGSVTVTIEKKPDKDGITYIMTSEDGMQYDPGVFVIEADTNKPVPVKETTHAVGFADAFTNALQAEIDDIAKTTAAEGTVTLPLKAFYEKSADPGIIGVGAKAQVEWKSSNANVVAVAADPVPVLLEAVDADVTTGGAIAPGSIQSYTATFKKVPGIALLTATIHKYNLEDTEVGEPTVVKFIVTTDANGLVSIVNCIEDADGVTVINEELGAIGGFKYGNPANGIINFDRADSTSIGLPSPNETQQLWGIDDVSSSDEDVITIIVEKKMTWTMVDTITITPGANGDAVLTIKIRGSRNFTLTYNVTVSGGVPTYTRLEIKAS